MQQLLWYQFILQHREAVAFGQRMGIYGCVCYVQLLFQLKNFYQPALLVFFMIGWHYGKNIFATFLFNTVCAGEFANSRQHCILLSNLKTGQMHRLLCAA